MRYLLVGLGNLGQRRRALLSERCVATVDPLNAAADYRDPAAVPDELFDAAVLSVPNQPKLELVEQLLRRGKHVHVDKPLLLTGADAARLTALSSQTGAVWYTSYNHRFEPLVQLLKRRLTERAIGDLYHARMLYGNGTVGNVVGTWRDDNLGVVEDLGSHLLDLSAFLLGYGGRRFTAVVLNHHESAAFDQAILTSADGRVVLELSFVSWRNSFAVEVWGSAGSLHLQGLRKWGGAELVERRRVLPSGVPVETRTADAGPDESWDADLREFETRVAARITSADNDRWIGETLSGVAQGSREHPA